MAVCPAPPESLPTATPATFVSAVSRWAARLFPSPDPRGSLLPRLSSFGPKEMMGAGLCGALTLLCAYCGGVMARKRGKRGRVVEDGDGRAAARGPYKGDWCFTMGSSSPHSACAMASAPEDSSLFQKHSKLASCDAGRFTYPAIRIVYRPHPDASQLPQLPLIVFVHGLGGQAEQFREICEYFAHFSPVMAIDLPGCGRSAFLPEDWEAYTTESLCSLLAKLVKDHLEDGQRVVLVGHSMGCGLAVHLAAKGGYLSDQCAGLVAICPKATVSDKEKKAADIAVALPEFFFDLIRMLDRRGGLHSKSVNRFVAKSAPEHSRKLQLRFNEQSRTPVWQRMVSGLSLPTKEEWKSIRCPIYLVGADQDTIAPTSEIDQIESWLTEWKSEKPAAGRDSSTSLDSAEVSGTHVSKIIVSGAGHGVLYEAPSILNHSISGFLAKWVQESLNYAWQLQFLNPKEDKWALKNQQKWSETQSVSLRVAGRRRANSWEFVRTPFRPMKTLRQDDPSGHNPRDFSRKYPDVGDVIDLSSDQPPYDPTTFEGDIKYHKYSIISKTPPTQAEVTGFIHLVDSILEARDHNESWTIACHCHYGYNRTGFFICSYMIERMGFSVENAIEAFKVARPPGIKHVHFTTALAARYQGAPFQG